MLELIPLLTFVTTVLFVLALAPPPRRSLRQRLAPYTRRYASARERELAGSVVERLLLPAGRSLASLAASTAPARIRERAALDLARAGQPADVTTYLALRGLAMLGLPLAYVVVAARLGRPLDLPGLGAVALLFLAGSHVSGWWVRSRISERERRIERALPSALDLITVCMEAGLAFDAGLAKVVEKTRGPLAEEFARALQEMQLGKPRREALRDLARRTAVRDLASFVAAISQADQMGISLAPVMRSQADEVRVRRRQRAEEQAMQAAIKMLFPLIFCILPAMVLVVLGPAFVTLYVDILSQMADGR